MKAMDKAFTRVDETFEAITRNADRIAIVSDGKLAGIFAPDASDAEYGLAMSGVTEGGKA